MNYFTKIESCFSAMEFINCRHQFLCSMHICVFFINPVEGVFRNSPSFVMPFPIVNDFLQAVKQVPEHYNLIPLCKIVPCVHPVV